MKRFYLLLFLLSLTIPKLWALEFEHGWFWYRVIDTNQVEVNMYLGKPMPPAASLPERKTAGGVVEGTTGTYEMYDITIPSTVSYEGVTYSVTQIGENAFYANGYEVLSITIPSSVKTIGDWAFDGCYNMKSISFSEGLLTIGEDAFEDCTALTSITLPNSVTTIGDWAFQNCTSLQYVYLGNNLNSIGLDIFRECSNLTVEWNVKGTHTIAPFMNQEGITSVIFGDDVTMIPDRFCEGMTSLSSVVLTDKITSIPNDMFDGCVALPSINIPNTITNIGSYAFYGCTSLTSVDIPASVTIIGHGAFAECEQLSSVTFNEGLQAIAHDAFNGCTSIDSIIIPNSVTYIEQFAFQNCTSLQYAYLGNNLNSIGIDIFRDCSNLMVEWNVKGTHKMAPFMNEESITSVIFGNDVTMIPDRFCEGMTSLSSVVLTDKITSIPNDMFDGCVVLPSINIPNTITNIGSEAFNGCISLTSVDIPASVTIIGHGAFAECEQLSSVTFNEGLLSIGEDAFYNCTSLDSIILPSSLTNIGEWAFQACSKLTYAQIDATVPPTLGGISIFEDTKLKAIHIPCGTKKAYKASDWNDLELKFAEIGNGFSLSVESADITMGDVAIILEPTSCDNNEAEIEAIPEDGYRFSHWSDGTDANPYLLTLTQDTTLIAFFEGGNCDDVTSTLYLGRGWEKEIYPVDDWYQLYCYEAQENGEEYRMIIQNQSSETVDFSIDFFVSCDSEDATYSYAKALNPAEVILLPFDYSNLVECYIHAVANGEVLVEWVRTDCGKNLYWDYADEHLTITGTGDMYDYVFLFDMAPWTSLPVSEISLPEGMTSIGAVGFSFAGFTSIDIPSSVSKIGDWAFSFCYALQSINIPKSVASIGDTSTDITFGGSPFIGCYNLSSITVEEGNTNYDSRENCNAIIHTASDSLIAGCRNTVIPKDIITIGSFAFSGGLGADEEEDGAFDEAWIIPEILDTMHYAITIPESVKTFGVGAFAQSYFDTLYMESHTPPAIDSTIFDTYPICYVPNAALETYKNSEWANYMGEIRGYELISTNISNPSTKQDTTHKFLHKGQLFIIRENKTYTIIGQEVK